MAIEISQTIWLKMGDNIDEYSVALTEAPLKHPRAKHVREPDLGRHSCQLNQLLTTETKVKPSENRTT